MEQFWAKKYKFFTFPRHIEEKKWSYRTANRRTFNGNAKTRSTLSSFNANASQLALWAKNMIWNAIWNVILNAIWNPILNTFLKQKNAWKWLENCLKSSKKSLPSVPKSEWEMAKKWLKLKTKIHWINTEINWKNSENVPKMKIKSWHTNSF